MADKLEKSKSFPKIVGRYEGRTATFKPTNHEIYLIVAAVGGDQLKTFGGASLLVWEYNRYLISVGGNAKISMTEGSDNSVTITAQSESGGSWSGFISVYQL